MDPLNHLSQRAQKLITNPAHLRPQQQRAWCVELDSSDKILTLSYSPGHDEGAIIPGQLFREVLSIFSLKRGLAAIGALSFREMESYLRDENHLPSFRLSTSELLEGEKLFLKAKMELLAALVIALLEKKSSPSTSQFLSWDQASLPLKNRMVMDLIGETNVFFPQGKLDFVLALDDTIYIKNASQGWEKGGAELFVCALLAAAIEAEKIKVVAVQ